MFRLLRSHRRFLASVAALLALGFGGTGVGLAHLDEVGGDDCDRQSLQARAAVVQTVSAPEARWDAPHSHDHQHCLTCHWFQHLRTRSLAFACVLPPLTAELLCDPAGVHGRQLATLRLLPSRAPPLAHLAA